MPAFTTNQWAILFLVLLLGWLLGLISRSGGAKWRRAYEAERDARAEELAQRDAALATANARIAELERERESLATRTAPAPIAASAVMPDTRDDLAAIRGIGPDGAQLLGEHGIHRYAQLAALSRADEHDLEDQLGADRGYIEQEQWREQAEMLAAGRAEEHRQRFG